METLQRAIASAALLSLASMAFAGDKRPTPSPPPASADSGLYFTKNDKSEHAAVGALFGLAGRLHFRESRWHALAVPAAASALKELADATQHGNHFSGRDFAAGVVGGMLGIVLADGLIYVTREQGATKVVIAIGF